MKEITKKYSNGEITIVWKPQVCIHSTICWRGAAGLPEVFNPAERPWIKPAGADTPRIVEQINKCPSGAPSFYYNDQQENPQEIQQELTRVEVMDKGPLMVIGEVIIKHPDGREEIKTKKCALCRCGHSKNKPYCDGSHREHFV